MNDTRHPTAKDLPPPALRLLERRPVSAALSRPAALPPWRARLGGWVGAWLPASR